MEISFNTPALLFPAITLLLLAYTNRFLAIANLIRKLHDEYISGKKSSQLLAQLHNLKKRINYIRLMQAMGVTDVWRRDATRLGQNRGPGYGLVFLDPPYGKQLGEAAITSCLGGGWLAPDALIVWEESRPPSPPAGLDPLDQRTYGDTVVTILRASDAAGSRAD